MAKRPVFIPESTGNRLVRESSFDFSWSPGFAEIQKRKNIAALHAAARSKGINKILEISSKSEEKIGRRLSAFSLKISMDGQYFPLESVYQGSKVFEDCGPHSAIFEYAPRDAKRYIRELDCGHLIAFESEGRRFPLSPKNAFYDWLYIRALADHVEWIDANVLYEAYTDIEFNPEKQVNCQARAFAEYKSLSAQGHLKEAVKDFEFFSSMLSPI